MQQHILAQMQKRFQESLSRLQDDLASQIVVGTAGGDKVQIEMNGKFEPMSVKIDQSLMDPGEALVLEDLVLVAMKDAIAKAQALGAEVMNKFTGGLNIPGLF